MDFENARQIIKESPALKELDLLQQGILLTLARVEKYGVEQTIFREGDAAGSTFFLLVSGKLNIQSRDGKVLRTADPGELIGEVGIMNPRAIRTRTVVAAKPSEVLMWDFQQISKLAPEFAEEFHPTIERLAFERISQPM